MSKTAYDQCDIASPPLKEWARSSVTGTVAVSRLAPGTYYFICAVGGHCGAGMKVTVIVKAKSDGPLLEKPLTASCVIGYCSYGYHEDDTPVLLSIEVCFVLITRVHMHVCSAYFVTSCLFVNFLV